jgi:hypothetical protein
MHALKRKVSLSGLKLDQFWVLRAVGEKKFHTLALIRPESNMALLVGDDI